MARSASTFKIEWGAHEYEHKERNSDWFWVVGIISVAIAITSVILGNIIFGILVLVGTFSLSLFINRPPKTVRVVIEDRGITKDSILYPYSTLDSFWIDLEHPHKKILLKSKKMFMPLIVVPLSDDVDADNLNEVLGQFLKEELHTLPFVERILEYVGF